MVTAPATMGEDHPRMRGEKTAEQIGITQSMGSPPHARGKVSADSFKKSRGRITPACAGKRGPQFDVSFTV